MPVGGVMTSSRSATAVITTDDVGVNDELISASVVSTSKPFCLNAFRTSSAWPIEPGNFIKKFWSHGFMFGVRSDESESAAAGWSSGSEGPGCLCPNCKAGRGAARDEGRRAGLGRDVCFRRCVATAQTRPKQRSRWALQPPTHCSRPSCSGGERSPAGPHAARPAGVYAESDLRRLDLRHRRHIAAVQQRANHRAARGRARWSED